jgi:hypothetical protein
MWARWRFRGSLTVEFQRPGFWMQLKPAMKMSGRKQSIFHVGLLRLRRGSLTVKFQPPGLWMQLKPATNASQIQQFRYSATEVRAEANAASQVYPRHKCSEVYKACLWELFFPFQSLPPSCKAFTLSLPRSHSNLSPLYFSCRSHYWRLR